MSDNLIGKNIGQYQIVEQIGQGGMATVYRAYQPSIHRNVAIKILPSQYAQDPSFVKRFEQEAKAIAALEHPHILPVYDFGTQEGLTYMVMRYIKGGTLSNLMGQNLSYDRVVSLIGDVARALDYAHKQGVVHRDIKPSNILIDDNGEPLLTDFGIAKMMAGSGATQLTGAGSVLGTPAYMSPEQAQGVKIDGRTDVYSLGVILYELLTGQQPYRAETPVAIVLKHVSEPLTPPRAINPNIPDPLEQVVVKAMAKEPEQRYQTAGEMQRALQHALNEIESGGRTVSLPTPSTQTQGVTGPAPAAAKKSGGMGPWLIGGVAVVALLCLLGGGLLFYGLIASDSGGGGTPLASSPTAVSIGIEKTPTPTDIPTATEEAPIPTPPTAEISASTPVPIVDIPGLDGEILFEDDFSSNQNDWPTGPQEDEYGVTNTEFVDGRYRMTQEAKQGVFVWNNLADTEYDNFIFSVEATPVEKKVASNFAYGLTLRENVDDANLYAFEVNSDGYYMVSVLYNGEWETLVEWAESPVINREGTNQLTVKAAGSSFTFYVNGIEVASLEDDTLSSGAIGVALDLYEEGDKATVDFDNLVIRSLNPDELAVLDATTAVLFEDAFDSDAKGWSTGEFEDEYSQNEVTIEDGRYTLSVTAKPDKLPYVEKQLPSRDFSDFILSVDATPLDSETYYSYGVAFRLDEDGNVYVFEIGNDNLYSVLLYDGEWKKLKDWSSTPAIKPGEANRLIISAKGSTLTFFVNDVQLTTLENDRLSEGKIALVVDMAEGEQSATVNFDNLIIRKP
ncbi:MAG: serine/threonine protein kinase [Anaerolineae bacterium]|nr:serine/threonine protein kinase [Anaerolineae bacterium]